MFSIWDWEEPKVRVIFEDHTVTHTNGVTYTRVRGRGHNVWLPIKLLPANPQYDHEYFVDPAEFRFYERVAL